MSSPDPYANCPLALKSRLRTAELAAVRAGVELKRRFGQPLEDLQAKSSPGDLVSVADTAAEAVIAQTVADRYADDGWLGEESEARSGSTGYSWTVDPLDGTANFVRGIPLWAVSVACHGPDGGVGVVYNPVTRELLSSVTGAGAVLLREGPAPAPPFQARSLDAAVSSGAQRAFSPERAAALNDAMQPLATKTNLGSAALSLAWTAIGRYDLTYFEGCRVAPWDVAAGEVLCREAGLVATWLNPVESDHLRYIAGRPSIVREFLERLDGSCEIELPAELEPEPEVVVGTAVELYSRPAPPAAPVKGRRRGGLLRRRR